MKGFGETCREIYYGLSPRALRAQYLFLGFDLLVITYFVVTTFLDPYDWIVLVDIIIGVILLIDFLCRLAAQRDRGAFLIKPMTIVDFIVIVSLISSPVVPAAGRVNG